MFPTKTLTPNPSSRSLRGQMLLITGANRGAERVYAAVRQPASAAPLVERHGEHVRVLQLDLYDNATIQAAAGLTDVAEPPAVVEGEVSE